MPRQACAHHEHGSLHPDLAQVHALLNDGDAQIGQRLGDHEHPQERRLLDEGAVPVGSTREAFAAHIRTELAKWAKVIRESGARID